MFEQDAAARSAEVIHRAPRLGEDHRSSLLRLPSSPAREGPERRRAPSGSEVHERELRAGLTFYAVTDSHPAGSQPGEVVEFFCARQQAESAGASTRVTRPDRPQLAAWVIVGLLGIFGLLVPGTGFAATDPCPRHLDDSANAPALSSAIALTAAPGSAQRIVNFGTSRATKMVKRLTFTADKPLPDSLTPDQLNFDALVSRAGDTLESTDFPDPTFSQPRISQDRQSVRFAVCLNPGSIPPGKYVGSVTLSGPPGLSAASLSLTVNAKTATLFYIGSVLSLIVAFLLLVLKDAAAYKKANAPRNWGHSFLHPLIDPVWGATTLVALGAAFGTLYAVYAGNPAWGSGGFSDIAALIGAGFAAVGGHTIITALTPS